MNEKIVKFLQIVINTITGHKPLTEKEFEKIDNKDFVSVDDYLKKQPGEKK